MPSTSLYVGQTALDTDKQLKGKHVPSKRNLDFQTHYPETIARLQKGDMAGKRTPSELKRFPLWADAGQRSLARVASPQQLGTCSAILEGAFEPSTSALVLSTAYHTATPLPVSREAVESFRKVRKVYEANRDASNRAIANGVIDGTAPIGAVRIYPVNCSHQSLLGIDGKLIGKSPDWEPPASERRGRRWLGQHIGWEGDD
jgi:hypothetical protein